MKDTMDVTRSEEKWPPGSSPRLCAHEVDIGICGAFDIDLLGGLSTFANHYAGLEVLKIHMQLLVCNINVLSGVVRYVGR